MVYMNTTTYRPASGQIGAADMATHTATVVLATAKRDGAYVFDGATPFDQVDLTPAQLHFLLEHGAYRVRAIDGVAYTDSRDEVVWRHRDGLVTFG